MRKFVIHAAALTALSLMAAPPVAAESKGDRAKVAVAEAQGKIDALNAMGAGGDVPRMTADAMAALRSAQDELRAGRKDEAIEAAHRASHLADTAVGVAERDRREAAAAKQADTAMAAQAQVSAAQDQAVAAQQQADAANARATNAEQAAASAAADAAAARAAATTPPPATTVTTETTHTTTAASAPVRKKRVVRTVHRATTHPATVTEKTTTTVTPR